MTTSTKNALRNGLYELSRKRQPLGSALADLRTLCVANGIDPEVLDGIYCGEQGRATFEVDPKHLIVFEWYKFPSGNFEVNAYLS